MGNTVIYPMWAECPMFTRMVIVGYPSVSMLLLIFASMTADAGLVDSLFTCSIDNMRSLKLWTLFWAPFYNPVQSGMGLLTVLIELYMAVQYFPQFEKDMGSTSFLLWTFLLNALNSLVFLSIMFCMMMISHFRGDGFREAMAAVAAIRGLWPLVMVCLTLTALSNPDQSTSLFGMVQIPNKWYPIALTGLFMLLNGFKITWSLLSALAVGYAYSYFRLERFMVSKIRVDRLEQRCCRGGRCSLLGASWIPAASTSSYDTDVQVDRRYRNFTDFGSERTTQSAPTSGQGAGGQFVAFGGSGNRLGESTELAEAARPRDDQA